MFSGQVNSFLVFILFLSTSTLFKMSNKGSSRSSGNSRQAESTIPTSSQGSFTKASTNSSKVTKLSQKATSSSSRDSLKKKKRLPPQTERALEDDDDMEGLDITQYGPLPLHVEAASDPGLAARLRKRLPKPHQGNFDKRKPQFLRRHRQFLRLRLCLLSLLSGIPPVLIPRHSPTTTALSSLLVLGTPWHHLGSLPSLVL